MSSVFAIYLFDYCVRIRKAFVFLIDIGTFESTVDGFTLAGPLFGIIDGLLLSRYITRLVTRGMLIVGILLCLR